MTKQTSWLNEKYHTKTQCLLKYCSFGKDFGQRKSCIGHLGCYPSWKVITITGSTAKRTCSTVEEGISEERLKSKDRSVVECIYQKHEELWGRYPHKSKVITSVKENKETNLLWLWRPIQPKESIKKTGSIASAIVLTDPLSERVVLAIILTTCGLGNT